MIIQVELPQCKVVPFCEFKANTLMVEILHNMNITAEVDLGSMVYLSLCLIRDVVLEP